MKPQHQETALINTSLNPLPLSGATLVENEFEEELEAKVVTSELSINKFSSANAGEYSCRLDSDGSLLRVSEQRVILKLQGFIIVFVDIESVFVENLT